MLDNQALYDLLQKELKLLEELNGLSLLKKEALLKDDLASLETIVLKEEALSKNLRLIDDACSPQVKFFFRALMDGPRRFAEPSDEKTLGIARKIREVAIQLKRNNEFNQTLLTDAIAMTQFELNLLLPQDKMNAPVYGSSGKVARNEKKTFILDYKG